MKPLITFLACIATGSVVTYTVTDEWWATTIGAVTLIFVLGGMFFSAYLWGMSDGISIGQKNHDLLFREGFQTGKHWRG